MTSIAETLKPYRARIDALDDQIVDLLVQRFAVIREVGHLKAEKGIPAVLEDRVREVISRAASRAGTKDDDLVREVYTLLVTISCDLEDKIIDRNDVENTIRIAKL